MASILFHFLWVEPFSRVPDNSHNALQIPQQTEKATYILGSLCRVNWRAFWPLFDLWTISLFVFEVKDIYMHLRSKMHLPVIWSQEAYIKVSALAQQYVHILKPSSIKFLIHLYFYNWIDLWGWGKGKNRHFTPAKLLLKAPKIIGIKLFSPFKPLHPVWKSFSTVIFSSYK